MSCGGRCELAGQKQAAESPLNCSSVGDGENRVKRPQMSVALRQMRQDFIRPTTWVVLFGIAGILALSGAFGTGALLNPVALVLYWCAVAVLTYFAGSFAGAMVGPTQVGQPLAIRILVVGLATSLAVSVVMIALNTAVFGWFLTDIRDWAIFLASLFGISFIITAVLVFVEADQAGSAPNADPPRLLSRLPHDKRGDLIALSVEDHYVRVRTSTGEEMLLMRLGDAIEEAGAGGFQVHRSHWVSAKAVQAVRREGDRAVLTMTHGPEVPVSRRYVPVLKEAGLLPAK